MRTRAPELAFREPDEGGWLPDDEAVRYFAERLRQVIEAWEAGIAARVQAKVERL